MKKILVYIIVFTGISSIFAQNEGSSALTNEEINDLSSKLAMKILLNDSQKSSTESILKTYSAEMKKIGSDSEESLKNKEELKSSLSSKIKDLLDSKQKMKYNVLEKEWWASVDEELND